MEKILNRKKLRLKDFDYSSEGAYFITICTKNRENFFGEIVVNVGDEYFRPNFQNSNFLKSTEIGKIAEKCWHEIPKHYPNVRLDEFCVMPNHIHGILFLEKGNLIRNENIRSLQKAEHNISNIIRGFKIGVTKFARKNNLINFNWQRSFYDRIIRDENELNKIREYIQFNPENWEDDKEFLKL